ncbi:hypothetical protein ASD64_09120 [Mesorhizobium sp. Root157]|uniref:hypothetical protein n=1 Tax=Mesorhizobium sp. Root157 TaxID=1736477 RepID=UPI0006FC9C69|nr:hypothetical protein [Mesorhizobium sp. Root157]KQZ81904.1 hypothetical protein ASD64_09120 [Mesorhizobium sp. Root157]
MAERPRTLASLIEPGFADGYEQFRELIDNTRHLSELTPNQKVWARLFELVSVAMIEGLNTAETEQELPPVETVFELWSAIGSALATVNAQAFTAAGKRKVRHEMLVALKHGYDRAMQGLTEGIPEAANNG